MPSKPGLIYVNSEVEAERRYVKDGRISPFHYWGYIPQPEDRYHYHCFSRFDNLFRAYVTQGTDYRVLFNLVRNVVKGYHALYLVTLPDLRAAVPRMKAWFPKLRILSWAWLGTEVTTFPEFYQCCDRIFCLTEGALKELAVQGLGPKASLEILGTEPDYYNQEKAIKPIHDICLVGRSGRDAAVTIAALQQSNLSLVATPATSRWFNPAQVGTPVQIVPTDTHQQVVQLLHQSRVAWIPIHQQIYPAGYTNLIEALLCGTAVVIADSSTIPQPLLSLPGVYRYVTDSAESLIHQTKQALADSRQPGFRQHIQQLASPMLNGHALQAQVLRFRNQSMD